MVTNVSVERIERIFLASASEAEAEITKHLHTYIILKRFQKEKPAILTPNPD